MKVALGISWGDSKENRFIYAAAAGLLAAFLASTTLPAVARGDLSLVPVIVREAPGAGTAPEEAVEGLGGKVERQIGIVNGFSARVPKGALPALEQSPGVAAVTPDGRVKLFDSGTYEAGSDDGSMFKVAKSIKAKDLWKQGITGAGVTVAVIDSGVVPVEGLTGPGKVINGADLSFESQADNLRHLDSYGHGTHVAGIIAGLDTEAEAGMAGPHDFQGIAPGASILNVKVANAQGATDVSQVLAAIDWVVQHRSDNGMNVKVINLSFGTDGVQDYLLDPLTFATEVAWHHGIAVVVAAGNSGYGSAKLNNPAYDPFVIAVGAVDTNGTYPTHDDVVPEWSSRGDGIRNPDLVAPGQSVVSLRSPNSQVDLAHPEGRVGDRFFRGSGTSQSAAVVSGAAALLLQQHPDMTPDQLKALLTSTAGPVPGQDAQAQGSGVIDLRAASRAAVPIAVQAWPRATGLGSLEAARGSAHVADPEGIVLEGEIDIFGAPWDGNSWSASSWSGNSWSGGTWNGNSWSGNSWSGNSWSGNSWSAATWTGNSWSGNSWSGNSWSGNSWSGNSWSGNSWSGNSWSGNSWSGNSWSGNSWSGNSWSGNSWSGNSWS